MSKEVESGHKDVITKVDCSPAADQVDTQGHWPDVIVTGNTVHNWKIATLMICPQSLKSSSGAKIMFILNQMV